MKRIVLTLIMCLLGLLGTKAQDTIRATINKDVNGTGAVANNNYYPVYTNWTYSCSASQMIYEEAQIKTAAGGTLPTGEISHIAFVMGNGNMVNGTRQWRVYIKTTTKSAFEDQYDWESLDGDDLCFQGAVTLPESLSGDVVVQLNKKKPLYNGGNIVVCVCEDSGAGAISSRAIFQQFTTPDHNRSLLARGSSSYAIGDLDGDLKGTNYSQHSPVIKFTIVPLPPFDLNVNVTDGTNPMQGVSVNVTGKDSGGSAVQVDESTDADGECTFVDLNEPDEDCYTVTISKNGYKTVTEEVCADDINEGEVTLNVVMEVPLSGPTYLKTDKTLYGETDNITFSWDQVSSPNVNYYRLYKKVGDQWYAVVTVDADATPQCTISNPGYGNHEYCVVAVYDQGESEKGEASALVVVTAEGSISGIVTSAGGSNLVGATVIVEYVGQDNTMLYKITTDSNGEFTIADVMTGEYKITASMPDFYDKIVTGVMVEKNQNTAVSIWLEPYPYWDCTVGAVVNNNNTAVYSDDYCEVTWSGNGAGLYDHYNIYRKNVETGEIELISHYTNITNQYYKDDAWVNLNDGRYQYGVAPFTGNILDVLIEEFNHEGAWPEGWSVKASAGSDWEIANKDTRDFVGYAYDDPYGYDKSRYWVSAKALNGEHLLITPQVNVREALLSFYYATSGGSGNPCLEVRWSTSPTGPWTEKLWVNTVEEETWFQWREKDPALDISELPEKYVYLAFVNTVYSQYANQNGGSYNSAFIDGVKLQSREVTMTVWSNEVEKNTAVVFDNGYGDHDWFTAENWRGGEVPEDGDNVKIIAGAVIPSGNNVVVNNVEITDEDSSVGSLTIENGATFESTGVIHTNNDPARFVINDGAQVYQNNEGVQATFNMNIVTPGSWGPDGSDHKVGWQFIASPFTDADVLQYVQPANGDYDLYKYDGSVNTIEWRNYKLHHDEFICHFASDAEGWTGKNGWEYAPLRNGNGDELGCMQITLENSAANDYLVSPRKLNIYPESRLRFYVKIHDNENSYMEAYSGINVVYSKQDDPTTFETIEAVEFLNTGWTMVEVDLRSIASTTDDVDAEEAWIAIQCEMSNPNADAILVDDIEFAYVYTLEDAEQFNAQPFEKTFVQGRGYMASYESATTVSMTGTLNHENAFTYSGLTYSGSNDMEKRWANFFLLGNPFPYDVQWGEFGHSGIVPGFAVVNSTSGAYQYDVDVNNTIKSGDGFMILTNAASPSLKFPKDTRGANNRNTDYINVVANGAAGSDNLIISLAGKENGGFLKLDNFNDDIAKVFVTNYDDIYGIAYYDEDVEEVDFCFNASDLGYYTISMIPNGDFTSLKLYDRVENIETDMIQNKEYKFFALSNDDANENRFVLRYAKKNVEAEGNFAYQSGNDLVVNAEGLIQIVDVMGRIVYSGETQGVNNRINVSGMENATYVIRNINNNEVRTQKIVIL